MNTATVTTIISQSVSIFPFLVAVINFKKVKDYLIPVFALLIVNVIIEIISRFFGDSGINFGVVFHVFTVLEFFLLSLFFASFFKSYFNPFIIYLIIPVFFIVAYLDYRINGLNSISNFSTSVESIILSLYALFFYYYALKKLIFENLLSTPVFWINTAVLFYFSGNFVLFVFGNYLTRVDGDTYIFLWAIIHSFFNVLYNVFLTIGFWKAKSN